MIGRVSFLHEGRGRKEGARGRFGRVDTGSVRQHRRGVLGRDGSYRTMTGNRSGRDTCAGGTAGTTTKGGGWARGAVAMKSRALAATLG